MTRARPDVDAACPQKTATSVNIKERLDFSCAVFDAAGELIANAPHMPVHLGSMDESIKAVIRGNRTMQPGDTYMLNAPCTSCPPQPRPPARPPSLPPCFMSLWRERPRQ